MIGMSSNKLADQLSTMPDQALPRMAQQYKDDAITLSMILSEKNRRDRIRQTGAAQQAQQPQAKVNDQVVASMQPMPETVGIGALPAPNMQGMAEGGIVGFADGGDVPGFSDGVYIGEGGQYSARPLSTEELAQRDPFARLKQFSDWAGRNVERDPVTGEVVRKSDAAAPAVSAAYPSETMRGAAASARPAMTPPTDKGGVASLGAGSRAPAAAPAGLSYLDQLKKTQAAMGPVVNPEQAAIDKLVEERNRGMVEGKKELEADIASRADQFKGREERIGKREAELGKQKESNTGLAFLEAGLAMMQARGPALAAIAQGAGVGVKQYQSGIKDLKLAQEKLDEARDRTDELKQNQSMMDKSAIRAANKDIRDASLAGQQYQLDARMKIYNENKADARAATTSDIASAQAALDRQSRERAAAAPSGVERMARDLGGKGGLEAGLRKYSEIMGPEGKGLASLVAKYAADPTALKLLETSDPATHALIKQQMQQMLQQPMSKPTGTAFP